MTTEKGRKEFEAEWNGQKGIFVLVADLKAGQLQRILRNCVKFDFKRGLTLDSFDYEEWIVQLSQKLIKQTPAGFDINTPDHIRNLDPPVWAEIEKFIGEHYPLMDFFSNTLNAIFGSKSIEQNSTSPTDSTLNAPATSDGLPSKQTVKIS